MVRLHDYLPSGNGYKVRLLLHQLGIPFRLVEVDITRGGSRTPAFLALNPNGRIPVCEVEPGRALAESHAICWYFAEGTRFVPEDRFARAQMLQWMAFEQYSLEPFIGTARFWLHELHRTPDELGERYTEKLEGGHRALAVLEGELAERPFLVEDRYTLADLALYAYTHVAEEGGFELAPYPAVRAWLGRVRDEPGHVTIDWKPESTRPTQSTRSTHSEEPA
jgi:glutathione S-transferase